MSSVVPIPASPRITPGMCVRLRREAVGLTLQDVAVMLETSPGVSTQRRIEWLDAIERDQLPISLPTSWALHDTIGLELRALSYWMAIAEGVTLEQMDAALTSPGGETGDVR